MSATSSDPIQKLHRLVHLIESVDELAGAGDDGLATWRLRLDGVIATAESAGDGEPLRTAVAGTVKSGKTTWQFGVQVNYYAEQSDLLGPKWMIAFNITPVVPNVFAEWLGATY